MRDAVPGTGARPRARWPTLGRRDVVAFLRALFSKTGLLIAIYIIIGVFTNTASPHLPTSATNVPLFHSWGQYFVSVMLWPLSYWKPTFTVGKWSP
jgi:hypothetical protein